MTLLHKVEIYRDCCSCHHACWNSYTFDVPRNGSRCIFSAFLYVASVQPPLCDEDLVDTSCLPCSARGLNWGFRQCCCSDSFYKQCGVALRVSPDSNTACMPNAELLQNRLLLIFGCFLWCHLYNKTKLLPLHSAAHKQTPVAHASEAC